MRTKQETGAAVRLTAALVAMMGANVAAIGQGSQAGRESEVAAADGRVGGDAERQCFVAETAELLMRSQEPGVSDAGGYFAGVRFAMHVTPGEIADAIYGQRVVLLVDVENCGCPARAGAVAISAAAPGAQIGVQPREIVPGEVCEITVIPRKPATDELRPAADEASWPPGYPLGDELVVEVRGERDGLRQLRRVRVNILPGEDHLADVAAGVRDSFIPWLVRNHPELGIKADTRWEPTIVRPHILVVSHYLFFSDEWELGVMWHNTIPPHDWSEIYLRPRYIDTRPQYAFRIVSRSAQPAKEPYPVTAPEQVDR